MGQDIGFRIGTIGLISGLFYALHHVVFTEVVWSTLHGRVLLVLFNFLCLMIGVSYYYAHTTDPGAVPPDWRPNDARDKPTIDVSKISSGVEISPYEEQLMRMASCAPTFGAAKKTGGAQEADAERANEAPPSPSDLAKPPPGFCTACQEAKPPRSHHCRDCYRCVLCEDHHCPWIDNCVGHFNHKYFLQFLFYVVTGVGLGFGLLIYCIIDMMSKDYYLDEHGREVTTRVTMSWIVTTAITGILLLVVFLAVGALAWDQASMLRTGITTIEWYEYKHTRAKAKRLGESVVYQHDMGSLFRNLLAKTGPRWRDVFFPTPPPGDGLAYVVRHDATPIVPPPPKTAPHAFQRPAEIANQARVLTGPDGERLDPRSGLVPRKKRN